MYSKVMDVTARFDIETPLFSRKSTSFDTHGTSSDIYGNSSLQLFACWFLSSNWRKWEERFMTKHTCIQPGPMLLEFAWRLPPWLQFRPSLSWNTSGKRSQNCSEAKSANWKMPKKDLTEVLSSLPTTEKCPFWKTFKTLNFTANYRPLRRTNGKMSSQKEFQLRRRQLFRDWRKKRKIFHQKMIFL